MSAQRYVQDLPPKGGYKPVNFARHLPQRGPSGAALLLGTGAVMLWGFYKVGKYNENKRDLKMERLEARRAIIPALQAEEDVRFLLARKAQLEEEAKIMKGVPEWQVGESVYKTKYMYPAPSYAPRMCVRGVLGQL